ncbi:MAG: hypothetical protein WA775_14940 [Psychroserpens sp.]|uniref:hypothetical protein n=1 Tax=Psychroserpens sp. TaxID=2020870 RepID=UPI003C756628
MKFFSILKVTFLLLTTLSFAQVGIGIEVPDPSSILHLESTEGGLLLPKLTTVQRDAITDPANGLTIYNTDVNGIEVNTGTALAPVWDVLTTSNNTVSKDLTLYRDLSGGSNNIQGDNDTFYNMPLGTAHVTNINNDIYTVLANGSFRVEESGVYNINASIAVENLRGGDRKFILAIFRGSTRLGYLARGFVGIPGAATNTEFFGTSGTFQYEFNAGDVINIRYVFNNDGTSLNGNLCHIGFSKI